MSGQNAAPVFLVYAEESPGAILLLEVTLIIQRLEPKDGCGNNGEKRKRAALYEKQHVLKSNHLPETESISWNTSSGVSVKSFSIMVRTRP